MFRVLLSQRGDLSQIIVPYMLERIADYFTDDICKMHRSLRITTKPSMGIIPRFHVPKLCP